MKIEKEKPQVEPEAQLLEEDELGKVSGGGPVVIDQIWRPRPKDSTSSETWTCPECNEVMALENKLSHRKKCSKKP